VYLYKSQILWFVSILGHVVVFGGNTPTPSTYEILNIDSIGSWTLANFTLGDQAKESITHRIQSKKLCVSNNFYEKQNLEAPYFAGFFLGVSSYCWFHI
jgi:hypothetical protein